MAAVVPDDMSDADLAGGTGRLRAHHGPSRARIAAHPHPWCVDRGQRGGPGGQAGPPGLGDPGRYPGARLGLALAVSPALRSEAQASAHQQASVWDHQNTDLAAVCIVEKYPLTGVAPFDEPLPNALLWIWLGIPCTSTVRLPRAPTRRTSPHGRHPTSARLSLNYV
jgi:hypothetical protein